MKTKTHSDSRTELKVLAKKLASKQVDLPSTKEAKKLFSKVDALPQRK